MSRREEHIHWNRVGEGVELCTTCQDREAELERLRGALEAIAEGRWNVAVDRYAHKTVRAFARAALHPESH